MTDLTTMLIPALAGGAGGIAGYLYGIKRGHYRNNKYVKKFTIELFGAILTAVFLTSVLASADYQIFVAFLIGSSWAAIIQIARSKITKIVEAVLGEQLEQAKGDR